MCGPGSARSTSASGPSRSARSRSRSTRPNSTRSARNRDIRRRAREIRAELGNPRKILLGVDRLDYTKGIDVRLKAFAELLDEGRVKGDDTVLVQLATPSRERVESYRVLRDDIERQVGHINGEYGEVGHPVVHYLHRPVPRDELIAFFVAADVMLVTPLRDGMNLVAKEYVACRSDLGGALVLSPNSPVPQPNCGRPTWSTRTTSRGSRTPSRRRSTRPPKKADDGCGRCAARCSPTTSTAGRGHSSTRWRQPEQRQAQDVRSA